MKDRIIEFINYGLRGKELVSENIKIKSENETLQKEVSSMTKALSEINQINSDLRKEIEIYNLKEKTIDNSVLSDYLSGTNVEYKWQPKKKTLVRYSLDNFSDDQEYQDKYLAWLLSLGLKSSYSSEDSLIWYVWKMVTDFISDEDDYDTDLESFGTAEYWLTPQQAFDYYVTEDDEGDCDDLSALLYGAIITALKYCGYSDLTWRLKRVNIKKPVGHAICAWLNRKLQWKRIESTYYRSDFAVKWNDNSDIFKGSYTIVWHIFDEKKEYKLK